MNRVWTVSAVAVTAVLCGCSTSSSSDPEALQIDAKRVCHNFVKGELKSPASAKFSGDATSGSGDVWGVTGNVDSQNSFGALIRNTYKCVVTYDHVSNQWTLGELTGLDN